MTYSLASFSLSQVPPKWPCKLYYRYNKYVSSNYSIYLGFVLASLVRFHQDSTADVSVFFFCDFTTYLFFYFAIRDDFKKRKGGKKKEANTVEIQKGGTTMRPAPNLVRSCQEGCPLETSPSAIWGQS